MDAAEVRVRLRACAEAALIALSIFFFEVFCLHYGMFVHTCTCTHSDRNASNTVAAIFSVIQKL
jgi:hypothetical protein